jgi:DNA-binding NarL/FixJ family response regulator
MSTIRVLLVDDDEDYLQTISFVLSEAGIEVVGQATNGYAAIELTRLLRPDVVVTDISHPGPDGYAVTRTITEQIDGVKVLVFTGYAASSEVERSWLAGARGFLAEARGTIGPAECHPHDRRGGEFLTPELAARTTVRRPTPDW